MTRTSSNPFGIISIAFGAILLLKGLILIKPTINAAFISHANAEDSKPVMVPQAVSSVPEVKIQGVVLDPHMSINELQLAHDLKTAAAKLNSERRQVALKEQVINIAEMKLQQKLDQLKKIEDQLSKQVQQYRKGHDEKIKHLVNIYENMNVKKAAEIFDNLDLATLIVLLEKMKPIKSAGILAHMNSSKVSEISKILTTDQDRPNN